MGPQGARRVFLVRVVNDGNVRNTVRLHGTPTKRALRVRYLRGGRNVTAKLTGADGSRVRLAPGQARQVRMIVTVRRSAHPDTRPDAEVRAVWAGDERRVDTVRAVVRVLGDPAWFVGEPAGSCPMVRCVQTSPRVHTTGTGSSRSCSRRWTPGWSSTTPSVRTSRWGCGHPLSGSGWSPRRRRSPRGPSRTHRHSGRGLEHVPGSAANLWLGGCGGWSAGRARSGWPGSPIGCRWCWPGSRWSAWSPTTWSSCSTAACWSAPARYDASRPRTGSLAATPRSGAPGPRRRRTPPGLPGRSRPRQ